MDMIRAMRVYKEVGYDGMIMPDHAPRIAGDISVPPHTGYRQRKEGLAPDYICQGPREVDRSEKFVLVAECGESRSATE
jgi:hypothetical protein